MASPPSRRLRSPSGQVKHVSLSSIKDNVDRGCSVVIFHSFDSEEVFRRHGACPKPRNWSGIPSRNSHSKACPRCSVHSFSHVDSTASCFKLGARTFSCRLVRFPFQIRRNRQRSALASLRLVRYLARGRSRNRRSSYLALSNCVLQLARQLPALLCCMAALRARLPLSLAEPQLKLFTSPHQAHGQFCKTMAVHTILRFDFTSSTQEARLSHLLGRYF